MAAIVSPWTGAFSRPLRGTLIRGGTLPAAKAAGYWQTSRHSRDWSLGFRAGSIHIYVLEPEALQESNERGSGVLARRGKNAILRRFGQKLLLGFLTYLRFQIGVNRDQQSSVA